MAKLFANSGDPDQMPHDAASDLGLHCLPIIFSGSLDLNGLTCIPSLQGNKETVSHVHFYFEYLSFVLLLYLNVQRIKLISVTS